MFIGHFAVGFAAKRITPRVSLGTSFLAAQFLDLLWPTLLLAGVETARIEPRPGFPVPLVFEHYPVSHSLLAVIVWGVLFAIAHVLRFGRKRDAVVLGLLVVSHWVLDLLVHVPDLPLLPAGGPKLGLGLWNWPTVELVVELALFAAGVRLYTLATRPADRTGRYALVGLVAFLLLTHIANLFGEPPPSMTAVAWVGQAQWLLVGWGYWVDAHRNAVAR